MRSALIGHTGFVGSNLSELHRFSDFYNSSNFQDMSEHTYDVVVCCGVNAAKWIANRDPEQDRKNIKDLENVLSRIQTRSFILISTVDVYALPVGVDENSFCKSEDNHAYGRNRWLFEEYVRHQFEGVTIVRLPGLFGPRLKKNIIFDLMNDNGLGAINPRSVFQWYDIGRLWQDIETTVRKRIPLVNLVTEPVETSEIVERFFPDKRVGKNAGSPGYYDVQSTFASEFGGKDGYLLPKEAVLQRIEAFIGAPHTARPA